MEPAYLTPLFDWLQAHPLTALGLVFLTAFGESLAFVGILVPGAVLMVAFGALVALDVMPLGATLLAAILGAIAGDGLSYWLGHHYRERLRGFWPFSRHPELLMRGEAFFHRHGGKSVLFGRFFGPVRAVVPAVAGMLEMPAGRFLLVNVISAILWAPAYLLPGLVFGASLDLASEFAGRFTVLLVGLLAALFVSGWLIRQFYLWLQPLALRAMARALEWSRRHPVLGEVPAAIVSPTHPEVRGLTLLALILLVAAAGFALLAHYGDRLPLVHNLDLLLHNGLQDLRSPPFEGAMVFLAGLADPRLLAAIVVLTAGLLLHQGHRLALWHWLAAFGVTFLFALVARHTGRFGGPMPPFLPGTPGGNLMLAVAVYGFLAILAGRGLPPRWHLPLYLLCILLLWLIAFADLYLGLLWASDALASLLLGVAWTALLGIAYRRHARIAPFDRRHGQVLALVLVPLLVGWPLSQQAEHAAAHAPPRTTYVMDRAAWRESGWQLLPAVRADLRGDRRFVFNLQWAAPRPAIEHALRAAGWQPARHGARRWLNWFNPLATADALPLLPQVHAGRYDAIRYWRREDDDHLWVVRLWESDYLLRDGGQQLPLWYGQLARMRRVQRWGLNYLVTDPDAATALATWRARPGPFAHGHLAPRDVPLLLLETPAATNVHHENGETM